jgi:hypothetical protein
VDEHILDPNAVREALACLTAMANNDVSGAVSIDPKSGPSELFVGMATVATLLVEMTAELSGQKVPGLLQELALRVEASIEPRH